MFEEIFLTKYGKLISIRLFGHMEEDATTTYTAWSLKHNPLPNEGSGSVGRCVWLPERDPETYS